ncbi:MAG TPA: DNA repair protein RecN [Streptosporangiaceae bacterium]|nr:DNA repair protein RecN [Streptosporangiaceae bacterium]
MLEEVRITGLGVIEDAVLEFSPGFTVVTGETGAGKTMVVTGLGLMFGGRADPARVRPGADRATVEGRLRIEADGPAAQQVLDAGGELDDGRTLIVSRSVSAEGRSRAYAGGRGVPVSLLIGLADDLVAVHGQADQQQLLRAARQRQALDEFAGPALSAVMADYQRAYTRHREVQAELSELTARARERAAEAEDLRRALDEIERAEPAAGEDTALLAEEERLGHADALHAAATTAHGALLGDPSDGSYQGADAVTLLGTARQALDGVAAHDPDLAGLAARLSEAAYLISDVATDLASYVESLDSDPARLAAVQERRAELTRLIRAYGSRVPVPAPAAAEAGEPGTGRPADPVHPDGAPDVAPGPDAAAAGPAPEAPAVPGLASVLAWAGQAKRRLTELSGDDDRIGVLGAEEARLAETVRDLGGKLTALRKEAAERFAVAVTEELSALAMPHAKITVPVNPQDEYGPHGADEVEIRLAAHPGAPALPLAKGASGGELSRVMLAIEVVFAGADPVPTFVFDEVDAGVGGKAAVEIGRRLARLARRAQVIVVTHLPQVAAFADAHLVVEKASDGSVVSSGISRLDDASRVRELSRMLAGLEDSEYGQAHAGELLAAAGAERASQQR